MHHNIKSRDDLSMQKFMCLGLNTIIYYIVYLFALKMSGGKRHKRCICCNKVSNHLARGHRSAFPLRNKMLKRRIMSLQSVKATKPNSKNKITTYSIIWSSVTFTALY